MSNIDEAIQQAKAKAEEVQTSVPATAKANPVSTAVNTSIADTMLNSSPTVDYWLKLDGKNGFFSFGTIDGIVKSFKVIFDFSMVRKVFVCRYQMVNGSPSYVKSYDQQMTSDGSNTWADAVLEAKKLDPKATVYESAELAMEAFEDITSLEGDTLVEKGETIGKSTSQTEFTPLKEFYQRVAKEHGVEAVMEGTGQRFVVEITTRKRKAKGLGGNTHHIMDFGEYSSYDG